MTPQFLRSEAARFRRMADTADREATKVRLLTMATDYDARAGIDAELIEPTLGGAIKLSTARKVAKELQEAVSAERHSDDEQG
jgi:hypothetical protein